MAAILARLEGLEPPTDGLEIRCSIHLSYRRGCAIPGPGGPPRVRPATKVGARGFEPPTPCSQSRCATGLRYAPKLTPRVYQLGRAFPSDRGGSPAAPPP